MRLAWSCTGTWYAAHLAIDAEGHPGQYGALLCVGAGPLLHLGAVNRLQWFPTYEQANRQAEAFTEACARWRTY